MLFFHQWTDYRIILLYVLVWDNNTLLPLVTKNSTDGTVINMSHALSGVSHVDPTHRLGVIQDSRMVSLYYSHVILSLSIDIWTITISSRGCVRWVGTIRTASSSGSFIPAAGTAGCTWLGKDFSSITTTRGHIIILVTTS